MSTDAAFADHVLDQIRGAGGVDDADMTARLVRAVAVSLPAPKPKKRKDV